MLGIGAQTSDLPVAFNLSQNRPNPFNPVTRMSYSLSKASPVRLVVYNLMGQRVITLIEKHQQPGYHTATWDGRGFSSGIYLYWLTAGEYSEVRRMTLLK